MRHRRGVEPTEAGLILMERGELLLRMSQQVASELRSHGAEPVGQVGVGFPPSIAHLFIGRLLSKSLATLSPDRADFAGGLSSLQFAMPCWPAALISAS